MAKFQSELMCGLLVLSVILNGFIHGVVSVSIDDLVQAEDYELEAHELEPGDDNEIGIELKTSVHLYSNVYDYVYINTNGILTFGAGYREFVNQPLPIEYAAIAPLYSNVDTSDSDQYQTSITYFESDDSRLLRHLQANLYGAFSDSSDFDAIGALVVTWLNVGHFMANNTQLNTFQAVILSSEEKTYVQFMYPRDGLRWIQADIGPSGLGDVRAQAGFVSEDGRFFKLPGSATDNAKYLDRLSNYDEPGSWWFLVGPIAFPNDIIQPHSDDHLLDLVRPPQKPTCSTHGLRCHETARCEDTVTGFCCKCRAGYYGNGYTCLKNDAPVRLTGRVSGQLADEPFSTQIQAYVTLQDGQTFSAITPLSVHIGRKLQLLQLLAGPIGWLFGLPIDSASNGYQLTGGKFNYSAQINFHGSDRHVNISQRFTGLNVYDQLEVEIKLYGDLPEVPLGANVVYPNIVEEYVYSAENRLRSIGTLQLKLNDEDQFYSVEQEIEFETCPYGSPQIAFTDRPIMYNKVFKVSSAYAVAETALRISMSNKITLNRDSSACTDGTATCGDNTLCIVAANDSYDCICLNGYLPSSQDQHSCGDIDECADSTDICDLNALCINVPGGYECKCRDGFIGNGSKCISIEENELEHEKNNETDTDENIEENDGANYTEQLICAQCSENAVCNSGKCECKDGFTGDGTICDRQCSTGYGLWSGICQPIAGNDHGELTSSESDEEEIDPLCHLQGCTCSTGYYLIETIDNGKVCRKITHEADQNNGAKQLEKEDDKLPCDIDHDCSSNATCEFIEDILRHKCVCKEGFEGNGYECIEHDRSVSCTIENNCHEQALCLYDESLGRSVCQCSKGWEGDGLSCVLEPECSPSKQCAQNSICNEGTCECVDGFERSLGLCVLVGNCGGAYCAENANCLWDEIEQISYCECESGYIGDGVRKCEYIPPPCNVVNNCHPNAACDSSESAIYQCVCNAGYYGDGYDCKLKEDCQNTPTLCGRDAQCQSSHNGFVCVCNPGFVGNGSYCDVQPRFDSDFLLISRGLSVIRMPFSGPELSRPIVTSFLIMDLDTDCIKGRVYWSDVNSKKIVSALYDGRDKQTFISDDIQSPEGIAIDWISRRLYWTDSQKKTIEVASLDNPKLRAVIIKELVNPRGIAVDPILNKIYWSDWNRVDPKIEWSNLDGSHRQVLLSQPNVLLPNHVAINPVTRELCFVDAGTKSLECINTYNREVETIATNLTYPFGLTISESQFYWTDWLSGRIERIDLSTQNRLASINIPMFRNHRMYGITVPMDDCPLIYSPCSQNADCTENSLCLVNIDAPGQRTCT